MTCEFHLLPRNAYASDCDRKVYAGSNNSFIFFLMVLYFIILKYKKKILFSNNVLRFFIFMKFEDNMFF